MIGCRSCGEPIPQSWSEKHGDICAYCSPPADNSKALLSEIEALQLGPNDRLVLRIDPSVELEAAGFHEALQQVIVDCGLAGRVMVISLPITKVEFAVFRDEEGLRAAIKDGG